MVGVDIVVLFFIILGYGGDWEVTLEKVVYRMGVWLDDGMRMLL